MRNFLKPLSFLPALLLMYMIYSFSAQEGAASSALSFKASYYIVKTADKILDAGLEEWEIESFANRFHGVTRKLAHMTEYFALAIAVAFPLYVYGLHGILLMITAGMICVAFACGDEYHQSFVAGRGPSKRDVLIDSFGIFWGIIVVRIIGWTGRKTIFRPLRPKKNRRDDYYEDSYYREPRSKKSRGTYSDYDDRRYEDSRYEDSRYDDRRYEDSRYEDSRYGDRRYEDSRYEDSRYDDPRYEDSRYEGSRYDDPRYENSRYDDPYYGDSRYDGPYDDPYGDSYDAPSRRDHSYYGREEHVSDRLSEDMSLKKLVKDLRGQHQAEKK